MGQSKIIGAIEIGTGKVVALVGELTNGRSLKVIGLGESPSRGVSKGEIYDFEAASKATHRAIQAAEKSSGVQLETVYVSQTGRHLQGFFDTGSVNITASDKRVTKADIARAIKEAKSQELPDERVYIHHVQNAFKLDGRKIDNPYGMEGRKLDVGYWSIHADMRKVRDQIHIINGFGIQVDDIIISSVSSASIVANDIEKKNGVLVMDIGCGTTDFLVYKDGYIIQTGVVAVGGDHLTNDISMGLRINLNEAEKLKLEAGSACVDSANAGKDLVVESQDRSFKAETLFTIIEARVAEVFSIIKKQVENTVSFDELAAGVIITGGTAQLKDIEKVAASVFGTDVRIGENTAWTRENLQGPQYSTVLGLLNYAHSSNVKEDGGQKANGLRAVINKFAGILARR